MLAKRLIACLDVRDGAVVKGINFEGLRKAGDPAALARRYNAEGIDELVILDVTATPRRGGAARSTIEAVARELFIPLTSAAASAPPTTPHWDRGRRRQGQPQQRRPGRIRRSSPTGGALRLAGGRRRHRRKRRGRLRVFSRSGTRRRPAEAGEWAREAEARGAGEILLTSIDRDGTRSGFDCELTAAVSTAVSIPVIASGGAGTFEHFAEVFTRRCRRRGARCLRLPLLASMPWPNLKQYLAARGVPIRPVPPSIARAPYSMPARRR
jgi:imidazole glycerol-phosphate synthase subunit HisF